MQNIPKKESILHKLIAVFLLLMVQNSLFAVDYTKKAEVRQFIQKMHKRYNYKRDYLVELFQHVRKNPHIPQKQSTKKVIKSLNSEHRPQGKWDIYSRMHLEHNQTNLGAEFMFKHYNTLQKAYKKYGVPPEYITAIIGIESYFGKNCGAYYVFDSLTHLAFDNGKRKKFYRYQLQEFLRMCYKEQVEPRVIKGSRSGAIGLAQFMPSNYKHYAVDFNNDGKIRLSKAEDAIGSIANYFKKNGWKRDEPVGTRVRYKGDRFYGLKTGFDYKYHRRDLKDIKPRGYFPYKKRVMLIKLQKAKYDELWYGAKNFYVITRYNHSDYYAMAVHKLATKIKKRYLAKYQTAPKKNKKLYLAKQEVELRDIMKFYLHSTKEKKVTTFP